MSWHFSRALVAAYSADTFLGGAPSALWSSTPTAQDYSCSVKMTGTCHRSPYGMMSVPSTDNLGAELLMWFRAGFLVKTLAAQESEQELMARSLDCGGKWPASLAKSNRRMSSSKTRHTSGLVDSPLSSATLPAWGIMRSGEFSALIPLEPHKSGTECGLLPTPTTKGNELSPSMQKWPVHRRLLAHMQALRRGEPAQEFIDELNYSCRLPTPTTKQYGYQRGGSSGRVGWKRASVDGLTGGPWIAFREWMMGWPIGWTIGALDGSKFQQWLNWHGNPKRFNKQMTTFEFAGYLIVVLIAFLGGVVYAHYMDGTP